MPSAKYTFIVEQGTTWDQYINLKDGNSSLVDLEFYTASMQIRSSFGGTKYADVSCSIHETSGSTTIGTIRMYLTHEDTSNLSFDTAVYDLEIASGSTATANSRYVERILQGRVKLDKGVTI
tara:strand:- start:1488 stop:1853 length:366 start_codon:yes stop_codon:yes gene_type:complete